LNNDYTTNKDVSGKLSGSLENLNLLVAIWFFIFFFRFFQPLKCSFNAPIYITKKVNQIFPLFINIVPLMKDEKNLFLREV
jgi:hypothetical protein